MVYYVDTSAFIKLVVQENNAQSLRRWVRESRPRLVASELLVTESLRAANRFSSLSYRRMQVSLRAVNVIRAGRDVFRSAIEIQPTNLGTLDSIHVASAFAIGELLEGVITYDALMADSCNRMGMTVVSPRGD